MDFRDFRNNYVRIVWFLLYVHFFFSYKFDDLLLLLDFHILFELKIKLLLALSIDSWSRVDYISVTYGIGQLVGYDLWPNGRTK